MGQMLVAAVRADRVRIVLAVDDQVCTAGAADQIDQSAGAEEAEHQRCESHDREQPDQNTDDDKDSNERLL